MWKAEVLYDSNYMTFWKRQKKKKIYGYNRKITDFQGLRGRR